MITKEQYEEISDRVFKFEDVSCSCHINAPCSRCTDGASPEEIQSMKEYESTPKTITIDIETTGLPPKNSDYKVDFMSFPRILSIAFKLNDEPTVERIINQGTYEVSAEITAINGITNQMCMDSPHQLEGVLVEELLYLGDMEVVIGHNIYFDTSIIKANVLRLIKEGRITEHVYNQIEGLLHKDKRIDTMRAGQKLCGGKWPKLTELHLKLFDEAPNISHQSGRDVDTTYKCYSELVRLGVISGTRKIPTAS